MFEQQHILKENQIVSTFLLKFLDLTVSIVEKIIKKTFWSERNLWQKQSLIPATYTKYIFAHSYSIFISKYKPRNQILKKMHHFLEERVHTSYQIFFKRNRQIKIF